MKLKTLIEFLKFKRKYPEVHFLRPYKWGGTYYSQDGQDLVLSALIFKYIEKSLIEKVFVDVGANHPSKYSNSFFFEKYLGFKTIAIDPQLKYDKIWNESRQGATFINAAIGRTDGYVELQIPDEYDMFSSIAGSNSKINEKEKINTTRVKITTLSKVLEEHNLENVGILSVDVEGYEQHVIDGIDFNKFNIAIIIIENNYDGYFGSEELRKNIISKGYSFTHRIGWLDDIYIKKELIEKINLPK